MSYEVVRRPAGFPPVNRNAIVRSLRKGNNHSEKKILEYNELFSELWHKLNEKKLSRAEYDKIRDIFAINFLFPKHQEARRFMKDLINEFKSVKGLPNYNYAQRKKKVVLAKKMKNILTKSIEKFDMMDSKLGHGSVVDQMRQVLGPYIYMLEIFIMENDKINSSYALIESAKMLSKLGLKSESLNSKKFILAFVEAFSNRRAIVKFELIRKYRMENKAIDKVELTKQINKALNKDRNSLIVNLLFVDAAENALAHLVANNVSVEKTLSKMKDYGLSKKDVFDLSSKMKRRINVSVKRVRKVLEEDISNESFLEYFADGFFVYHAKLDLFSYKLKDL